MRPRLIVALGATAAMSLIGRNFRVSRRRGELVPREPDGWITATVHPSSVLRAPDRAARAAGQEDFVRDLALAARRAGCAG